MQLSLRSQMIAGTTALVGASAIALTPVAPAVNLPALQAPSLAHVSLAAFDSPITALLNTSVMATNYLFSNANPADAAQWPFAQFGTFWGTPMSTPPNYPVLPAALGNAALGGYSSVGLIPQIIDDALPIISQLGYNGTDYLQVASSSLYGAAYSISEGIWNIPSEVYAAVGELFGGDPGAAIQTLIDAVVVPVFTAGSFLLAGGSYIASGLIARAGALLATIPELLVGLVGTAVGIPTALIGKTVDIVGGVVTSLLSFDLEGAWNGVVNGLLGPEGLPGTILNLTIGAGVQTGPIDGLTPEAIAANFAPSLRTAVQAVVKTVAGALATPVPASAATVSPAAARSAVAAPAAAVEAAPAAEAAAGEAEAAPSAATAREAAVEATAPEATAPAAESTAGDSTPAADDSAPAKGKGAAKKGGRG